MKFILASLLLLATSYTYSQNRGCTAPPHESIIEAKVFTSDGTEKTDQACVQFFQFQTFSNYVNHNSNEGSTPEEWVIHIEPGEQLILDSKFGSENTSVSDPNGFITVLSGQISDFQKSIYSVYYGSCYLEGKNYVATINEEIELEVASPTYAPILKIRVKVVEPEPSQIDVVSLPFISQVVNNDEVIITTNSELTEVIQVHSISGNLIRTFDVENGQKVQLADLPKGIYLLTSEVNGNTLKGKYNRL
ncbi:MAG: T9SS type A sorting domain-containing protein [Crocinitomicaceae bacterium]|nr:T9SS type A sorting domain-containing protein [Crocinitomicaceae bacterium]